MKAIIIFRVLTENHSINYERLTNSLCTYSTKKGIVNQRWKDVAQTQQQRPESLTVTLTWHATKYKVHKLHQRYMHHCVYLSVLSTFVYNYAYLATAEHHCV